MVDVILKDIKKVYNKDVFVIKGVNVEIKDKEFVVLVGFFGCGKFILFWMIVGLEEIFDGDFWIDNNWVNDLFLKDWDIVMVF